MNIAVSRPEFFLYVFVTHCRFRADFKKLISKSPKFDLWNFKCSNSNHHISLDFHRVSADLFSGSKSVLALLTIREISKIKQKGFFLLLIKRRYFLGHPILKVVLLSDQLHTLRLFTT